MLVHGGFWRSVWGADLMDAPAVDLTARGYATWNVEYRRPDHHGWQATTADVAAGLAALHDLATTDRRIDPRRVAVAGHSAGGQLALRLAADTGPSGLAFAVSLAGVVDLREGDRRRMGAGAVAAALGGSHEDVPWVYAAADPLSRLPLGVPHLVVQGRDDDLDLVDMARRYTAAARAAGDHVIHLEHPGDHFAVIDPATPIWAATVEELARHLHP
nr:alpha/beta hydrolase [Sphaerisporangium rubeum]